MGRWALGIVAAALACSACGHGGADAPEATEDGAARALLAAEPTAERSGDQDRDPAVPKLVLDRGQIRAVDAAEADALAIELPAGAPSMAWTSGLEIRAARDGLLRPWRRWAEEGPGWLEIQTSTPEGRPAILVFSPDSSILKALVAGEPWSAEILRVPAEGPGGETVVGDDWALIDRFLASY